MYSKHHSCLFLICLVLLLHSCGTSSKYGTRYDKYSRGRIKQETTSIAFSKSERFKNTSSPVSHKTIKASSDKVDKASVEYSKREGLISQAQKYVGTPYKYAGKNPQEGFDCSGFANFIYNENGFKISGPSHELAVKGVYRERDELKAGDLIFFGDGQKISHVAIVLSVSKNGLKFIHSSSTSGIKIEVLDGNEYWESRYLFGRDLVSSYLKIL